MSAHTRAIATMSSLLISLSAGHALAADADTRSAQGTCATPVFPGAWQKEDIEGNARIGVLVGADGNVLESKLLESSGYKELDKASLRASKKCTFKPAAKTGDLAPNWVRVKYSWVLK
ncbi:energy transducer TonB [Pseudoduganella namucuonensis]|uniref:Protein TonB n=1 Tax=Pseudoduganella namucuonensis TaxID=1035707 RepID=A0A1I7FFQ4_9BURK|nr:energy transducer TonB [Pseudoduganella namucuonensis]SFU35020.1 protein TonB [Pseudoduganella namucuonensis]